MIKYVLLVGAIIAMSGAQRAPYAGSPNRYPQVLPQYRPTVTANIDGPSASTVIGQRIGEEAAAVAANAASISYLPYDPYNDPALIERIKSWPKDKQPYWFVNREAIKKHLGGTGSTPSGTTATVQRQL